MALQVKNIFGTAVNRAFLTKGTHFGPAVAVDLQEVGSPTIAVMVSEFVLGGGAGPSVEITFYTTNKDDPAGDVNDPANGWVLAQTLQWVETSTELSCSKFEAFTALGRWLKAKVVVNCTGGAAPHAKVWLSVAF